MGTEISYVVNMELDVMFAGNDVVIVISESCVKIFDGCSVLLSYLHPSATIRFLFCEIFFAKRLAICNNILTFVPINIEAHLSQVIVKSKQAHPPPCGG